MKINFKAAMSCNYTSGRTKPIKYIVIHSDDTNINEISDFYSNNALTSSMHYFIGQGSIIQSVVDTDIAWHCGGKNYKHKHCRNDNSIGVCICSKGQITKSSLNNAVKLVNYLLEKYNLTSDNVIRHSDVSGEKICPNMSDSLWNDFRSKLKKKVKK